MTEIVFSTYYAISDHVSVECSEEGLCANSSMRPHTAPMGVNTPSAYSYNRNVCMCVCMYACMYVPIHPWV